MRILHRTPLRSLTRRPLTSDYANSFLVDMVDFGLGHR